MTEFPSRQRFVEWLQSRSSTEAVAKHWTACSCPLCVFLRACGAFRPAVFGGTWAPDYVVPLEERLPIPDWARAFIAKVDMIEPRMVTASDCLAIV